MIRECNTVVCGILGNESKCAAHFVWLPRLYDNKSEEHEGLTTVSLPG